MLIGQTGLAEAWFAGLRDLRARARIDAALEEVGTDHLKAARRAIAGRQAMTPLGKRAGITRAGRCRALHDEGAPRL
jgi:DNA-binding phage protein